MNPSVEPMMMNREQYIDWLMITREMSYQKAVEYANWFLEREMR